MKTYITTAFILFLSSLSFGITIEEGLQTNELLFNFLNSPTVEQDLSFSEDFNKEKLVNRWNKLLENFGEFKNLESTQVENYKGELQIYSLVEHGKGNKIRYITSLDQQGKIIGFHTYKTFVRPEKDFGYNKEKFAEVNDEFIFALSKENNQTVSYLLDKTDFERISKTWLKSTEKNGTFVKIESTEVVCFKKEIMIYTTVVQGNEQRVKYLTVMDVGGKVLDFFTNRLNERSEN
ncbi:MAG: DUF3887 domain-containing protein [Crocinitomicaceae bacterium]|jgi:hypothetical protein|nr:DUF3887 domain-containing protein [Crocinitomicaceae bacterium]